MSIFQKSFRGTQRRIAGGVRKAFTLVEVILSIVIASLVMLGCTMMMSDMVNIIEFFERGWTLRSHADGVEKFLRCAFMNSTVSKPSVLGDVLAGNKGKTIYMAHDPESSTMSDYYLAFGMEYDHPLLVSPFGFSPEKLCFLEPTDDGLWLVWRFVESEDQNGDSAIYRIKISDYVRKITYFYYDDLRGWSEETQPITSATASILMPSYIKLFFECDGEEIERVIGLDSLVDYQITK